MTDILSQAEIDQLLVAINSRDTGSGGFESAANTRKIKIYDFKRPDRFTKEHIRSLSILHETVTRGWSIMVSQYFLENTYLHLSSIDQLTYEEYIRSIPAPTTMIITSRACHSVQLPGGIIIEIDPAISNEFLYYLFDGINNDRNIDKTGLNKNHELTQIEKSALKFFSKRLLDIYSRIWNDYCGVTIDSENTKIETNPLFTQVVPPGEMVILVTIEARISEFEGLINICLPFTFLESLRPFLTAEYSYNRFIPLHGTYEKYLSKTQTENLPITLRVELFQMLIPYKDLIACAKKEAILYAPRPYQDKYCNLLVDKIVLFHGEIITDGTNSLNPHQVKITKILKPHKEFDIMEDREITEMEKNLANMKVQVVVELGRRVITLKELKNSGEGTIMELDKLAGEPVDIFANNILFARGEVVVLDENFGVRMTEIVGEEQQESDDKEKEV
jgi:flagellar motor switch protein FliM